MDMGSRPTGPEATIVGVEGEEGERGKPGDAKKLLKQNRDLIKQVALLNKTVDTLRHEKESLSVEKNKLKSDLKSAEKELKKVGSSLSSSRTEVEKLRQQHKLPKQSAGTTAEEMAELQKRVWQLEAQLTERNEKLANLRHKLGIQVERLEHGSTHNSSPDADELLKGREPRTTQQPSSLESKLQLEKETNAKLRKENSELQSRVTSLEGDLEQLQQQQQKDEEKLRKKGKLFKKTSSSSSLREHVTEGVIPTTFSADTIAGSDAYAELSARFSRQESPFSSPRNSPRLRRRNNMSLDGPTLQSCLKLSLEEKKVLEQEKEGLKMDLRNAMAELEQLQETQSCEKRDLMEQLDKACSERDKATEKLKLLQSQHNGTVSSQTEMEWTAMKEALEEENKRLKKDLEAARQKSQQKSGRSPPTAHQSQPVHRRSASTTSDMSSERKPATKRLSWSSESKDWRERKNSDSSAPNPKRAENLSTNTEDSKAKNSTSASGHGKEDKKSNGNGKLNSGETKDSPARRRALAAEAEKGRSKESFAAARAKFLSNSGTSHSESSPQKERSNSTTSTSDSEQTSTPPNSTSSGSAARGPSLESRSQSTVVLGKPPIHPSATSGSGRHHSVEEGSSTPPPTTSKAAALAKRMSWKVSERRKSFEEQSGGPPTQTFQSHHTRTASSPAVSRLSTSASVTEETETESQEQKLSVGVSEKKAKEKKSEKERKWEEERKRELEKKEEEEREKKRKKEMEEKRKREIEEKRKRELEEKERVRKEKEEEKERQRKEMEEKRKRDLEEKRKRELEEKERVRKEKEEKERQRKEMEEKRKREQEEKKKRELEEKERLRREREKKERQRKMEMERKKQEELEKQRKLEEQRRQEQEREKELQRQREMEKERERQREKEAALKRQRELEEQKKQEKEKQEQMRRKEEQERKKEEQRKEEEKEDIKYPSGSVAQRRQAFEKNSPSSSPPVVLRKKLPGSPAQRPKSMDFSALHSVQVSSSSPTTISPSPLNGSTKPTSISVTVSKSPQTSPLLNQRKEIKEVPVQKPIAKPNPPATAAGRASTVSIITTSSSPPLRRAQTLSSSPAMFSSLASSTPDLTSVGSTNGSSSPVKEIQVGGWSPGSQRKTTSTAFRHSPLSQRKDMPVTTSPTEVRPPGTEQRNVPRSPLSEKKMTKSVSFSPMVSTAGEGMSVTKPSPPPTPQSSMRPEKMSFKASPAKLMLPGAADMKKAASLQNIPEHAPAHNVSQTPTFTVGQSVAPRQNRRPRSERPNTTSLSRADTVNLVNLISKMQGREKTQNQENKGVSNGGSPTPPPQGNFSSPGRPLSMYGSITPSRWVWLSLGARAEYPINVTRALQFSSYHAGIG